jgi:short-subunit dehydrogenase
MATEARRTAVIIGASSGIGEALAQALHRDGWRLALLARRLDRLDALGRTLGPDTVVRRLDVTDADAAASFDALVDALGGVDLVVVSAGTGHNTRDLRADLDVETVSVNVQGFMTLAQAAYRHFRTRGRGHLVGITSVAAVRGNAAGAAYAASKAFQSVYLDGLRDLAKHSGLAITVTEVQPGFVETAMMKPERPLPAWASRLLVSSPTVAARQILRAIHRRAKHVYVSRRYGLIAFVLRRLPRPG